MSYLSTTENVGFSGIPQNISEASCATQYKMGVEGVSANNDVNIFIHDSSGDEQTYIPHLNDNFFHSKFKIDPNELYTFHDSDVIAGEITVSHTEDNYVFSDDVKSKLLESPIKEYDIVESFTNGDVKNESHTEVVHNGHYQPSIVNKTQPKNKEGKANEKPAKTKNQVIKEPSSTIVNESNSSVHSSKGSNPVTSNPSEASITSVQTKNVKKSQTGKQCGSETFLDVFKREKCLTESSKTDIKIEPTIAPPPVKTPTNSGKKVASAKSSSSKPKRGRGPAVHEALQRISSQTRAIAVINHAWHAPGLESYNYGPLEELPKRILDASSSDEDYVPDFDSGQGPVCVEETAAESRGARLELRRAAMRRHVNRAHTDLKMANDVKRGRSLVAAIKKQLRVQGVSSSLPTRTVNHLLAERGMTSALSSQERRLLRQSGWSGGESAGTEYVNCTEDHCTNLALPCSRYCLSHITLATEQRLYASCAAVFAGGARCKQPLLPLQDHTPLCAEHAWKRVHIQDNYDKLTQQSKPKKPPPRRRGAPAPAAPRPRNKPRRPPTRPSLSEHAPLNNELSVCSNSSAGDSSEDANLGALSDNEYIVAPATQHDIEVSEVEVGSVPADDILDPSVLSQIPDVAFTEFFNQGGTAFAESSELAAALEAVLDERVLDDNIEYSEGYNDVHNTYVKNKIPVTTSVSMEVTTNAPS